jgi:ABC-type nitrate/sulfonate/bicarbonate transport system ATPase subunit
MTANAADIEVNGLRKLFQQTVSGEAVVAIDRLDFRIRSGDMVAIVGQTGCGKSTFLNLLIGLDRPSEGRITIAGRSPYDDFDHFRGMLATVFQQDRLLPWRSALDNVRLPLELLGRERREQTERATAWLERLGLKGFEGAVVVTHQLEEAIELGGRILVFGKPGHILADINLATYPTNMIARLRADIQHMLQTNAPSAEIIHLTAKERR